MIFLFKPNSYFICLLYTSEKLFDLMPDYIMERKLRESLPLIVKIPDRHGRRETSEDMMRYISEAMGIKF